MSRNSIILASLAVLTVFSFVCDVALGPVNIPIDEVFHAISGNSTKASWQYIVMDYRMPKALTALLAGMALAVSGLMMQTLFRNPLAGPYVLGLTSGASMGVAFVILGSTLVPAVASVAFSSYGIVAASWIGSLVVLLAVLLVAERLRDTMAILIVGLMFGSFTSALVSVMSYFSTAEQLQKYTFWSLGNLGNLPWESVGILAMSVFVGLGLAMACIKPLDALLLGENYARSLGVDFRRVRLLIIIATSILAGSITAFAGPIAFIGLAVPHMARLLFRTGSHRVIFPASVMIGASVMLLCDLVSQLPGTDVTLPINAVTSIVGAPVVVWLLIRKRTYQ